MKPIIICLFLLLCFSSFISSAQKIEENKIDEFTKKSIKRTSWEKVCGPSFSKTFIAYTRVSKIDNKNYLNFKAVSGSVFSVREGDELMLKTKTDSIVRLSNSRYEITCIGCGATGLVGSNAEGINLSFLVSHEQLIFLKNNPIQELRLNTSNGYYEDDVSEKRSKILIRQFQLMD